VLEMKLSGVAAISHKKNFQFASKMGAEYLSNAKTDRQLLT
jgi:hypothetical protein